MSFAKDDEIKWLQTELVPAILKNQKLIENFSETDIKDFQILDIDIQLIGTEEAFMLTTCYKAKLKYEFKGIKNQVNLFVKKTPQLPQEIYDSINFKALFNNEILAYEKIMPAMEEFGKVNLKLAKYYYGKLEKNSAIVVTEDFSCDGWTVAKDMVNISLEHLLLGTKYLAQFHAVGFAMRKQEPQLFEELTKELKEPRYASDLHPDWAITLRQSIQRVAKATREYESSVDKKFIEDFVQLLGDNYSYGKKRVQPREPLVTLCHGDYLRNNVAFKYNDKGEPYDSSMFDLQTLRLSSPMVDLTVFLALSSFAEVRYANFGKIFQTYCDCLRETYEKLVESRIPDYLSYNYLLEEYTKFLPYSIGVCASFLMSLVEPKDISSQEMLMATPTAEEMIEETMTRGGAVVDRELAHQLKELYEFNSKTNANIFKTF